ncbi:PTS system mannose/fructose/sorbose family transporter subunit IID [Lactobacillus sp. ESL0684]|uniref:PTS system mannose/fructose/sorbose family transporter subunit IID n=1 Tax=unclassified Lactobacillus TaxID=2620435 RepID=UPI0023F71169|nr:MULTISPECIES: PTS system mannose/fructose/sorbose family transporter subunit IID [unclassified Lactobacillus]WEV41180.1 PTS system mannose/fructose/sorbose family transporter subunit IID [Lactobacillus sp. ESL0681]WEV43996.1 PTS system mannose/fructose/sorbose family transporter subunit IID [Lactobacillus sp. ESL0684]
MSKLNLKHLNKKDIRKVFVHTWLGIQLGWNYERMEGLGYAYSVIPALKKLYKDDKEKMTRALKMETAFFNTTPQMSHIIVGADIAMQDELGLTDESEEAITGLKTGLMGPFAGVGDTVFIAIYNAIIYSIAAYLALAGQWIGLLVPIIGFLAMTWTRWQLFMIGLKEGRKVATTFSDKMSLFTEGASILGLTVVGGMIPSVINYKLDLTYKVGKVSMNVQDMLDQIMPGLLPLLIALFSYWILGKKKMTSTKLIFVLIALGLVLGNLQPICSFIANLF